MAALNRQPVRSSDMLGRPPATSNTMADPNNIMRSPPAAKLPCELKASTSMMLASNRLIQIQLQAWKEVVETTVQTEMRKLADYMLEACIEAEETPQQTSKARRGVKRKKVPQPLKPGTQTILASMATPTPATPKPEHFLKATSMPNVLQTDDQVTDMLAQQTAEEEEEPPEDEVDAVVQSSMQMGM